MLRGTLTALALAASFSLYASPVSASSCVQFDIDFNLYAFGLSGADYNLGAQTAWTSGKATQLTTSGRPPFDGGNTQCFLSQFTNAIYVIDGDKTNPSDIHIYDATAASWSTQKINLAGADPTSLVAILDHDTNVFFAVSAGVLYQLDFSTLKAATGNTLAWESVESVPFDTTNYNPVFALAQNHIHFLDVPGSKAGEANIFVIHFAFFQPAVQSYPATSGNTFPVQHGKTASFFQSDSGQVQTRFAYVPDDGSATYVVDVTSNSTTPLAGPSAKDANAVYAASPSALVQLTSSGALAFLPFNSGYASAASGAAWTNVAVSGLPATGSSSAASGSSASASGSSASGSSASASSSGSVSASASGLTTKTGSASPTSTGKSSASGSTSKTSTSASGSASATPNSASSLTCRDARGAVYGIGMLTMILYLCL